jgi:hypothetical protein
LRFLCCSSAHHDAIIIMMRTTLTLPDDVYEVARSLAHSKDLSLGDAVAELVRQGLQPPVKVKSKSGFPCFPVAPDAAPITLEKTLDLEDEG